MRRLRQVLAASVGAATAVLGLAVPPAAVHATSAFSFTRLAGTDRYDTARVIATTSFATADTVVLATGENFPDALAGNFLAGNRTAPILLVQHDRIPPATASGLQALKAKNVVLLGGTDAISQAVEVQLRATPSSAASGGTL